MLERMRLQVSDGIARLVLTQAERGNPIDGDFCEEFGEVVVQLSTDLSVRAVLLSAEGKAFSYGGDIVTFVRNLDELPRNIRRWTQTLHSAVARLQRIDAPIVAMVHGVCAGGMVGVVAGADFLLASDRAKFVAAYAGIGFCPDAGTSVMLNRRVGNARARRFLLLGQTLDAKVALAAGLVDELLGADELAARGEALAVQLASGPTKAFGEIRRLMNSVVDQPLEVQLELEAQALARCAATADARAALTAFAENRQPTFTGE